MSYVDKPYLQKQFENFKQKITEVFAKKENIPTKTSDLKNDSGFVTSQYPVEILDEEATEANTTPDKYVSDAMVTRGLITRMGNMDFKYEDGVPKWSPRGADTFVPFSSGGGNIDYFRKSFMGTTTTSTSGSINLKGKTSSIKSVLLILTCSNMNGLNVEFTGKEEDNKLLNIPSTTYISLYKCPDIPEEKFTYKINYTGSLANKIIYNIYFFFLTEETLTDISS